MTEKRFTISIDNYDRKSIWDDERTEEEPLIALNRFDEIWGIDECCKLLNEQHEQIERLKRNFKALDEVKCELAEENEQLKQQINELIKGMQDSARMGADAMCKPMMKDVWGDVD